MSRITVKKRGRRSYTATPEELVQRSKTQKTIWAIKKAKREEYKKSHPGWEPMKPGPKPGAVRENLQAGIEKSKN